DSRLHVRNRFYSIVDGTPFRVSAARDGDCEVHEAIGRTMRIEDLARHMIVTSSNLATNLLVDLVGVEAAQQMVVRHGITGIELDSNTANKPMERVARVSSIVYEWLTTTREAGTESPSS